MEENLKMIDLYAQPEGARVKVITEVDTYTITILPSMSMSVEGAGPSGIRVTGNSIEPMNLRASEPNREASTRKTTERELYVGALVQFFNRRPETVRQIKRITQQ